VTTADPAPAIESADADGLLADLTAGRVTARAVTDAYLARIGATDGVLGSFLTVTAEEARAKADDVDRRREAGEPVGALAGLPVAVKDVLCTRGTETTAGSKILSGFIPPYDATVVRRLDEADAVCLGKANCDEFAMGSSNENSAYRPTANPWDTTRVPGGSSGGSAAAVAAGKAPVSLGTDTGGSVRQPASLTGLVGVKPTYGRVSRYGLIAFASSLDQVGPFARSVGGAARALAAIGGPDPADSTAVPTPMPSLTDELDDGVDRLRVGVVRQFGGEGSATGVRRACDHAVERLAALGADVGEVDLPHADYAVNAYYLIAPAEASSNLARYDGVRYGLRVDADDTETMMSRTRAEGFGDEVKRRIMIGTYALSAGYYDAYYAQAQRVRTLIIQDFAAAFAHYDVLVGPTAPETAFPLGEKTADPLAMYRQDVYTVPASLAGIPAVSVPAGFDDAGLPVGLQVMGPALGEPVILRAARALESDLNLDLTPRGPNAVPPGSAA